MFTHRAPYIRFVASVRLDSFLSPSVMPLFAQDASKKQKLEPSSSQEVQNSKVSQKHTRMRRGQGDRDAHEAPDLTRTDPRAPTEVEAPIPPLATTAVPLTSASTSTTPMAFTEKPLKGHKRFNADLRELKTGYLSDLDRGIWSIQSKFTPASTVHFTDNRIS
jgi:hypothetical protein